MSNYINVTPTWRALLPALVELAVNGETTEARRTAMSELYKLADAMDARIADRKEQEGKHGPQ